MIAQPDKIVESRGQVARQKTTGKTIILKIFALKIRAFLHLGKRGTETSYRL
jgi:hypothetical protein